MGLMDFIRREAIAPPSEKIIEELGHLKESLGEVTEHNAMLERDLETIGYALIGQTAQHQQATGLDIGHDKRKHINKECERMFRDNESIRRAVNLANEYVFGRGLNKPVAQDPRVQRVIDAFWDDESNKLVLTSYDAQLAKSTELQLYGEFFLLIFDQGNWGNLNIKVTERAPDANAGDGRNDLAPFLQSLAGTESVATEARLAYAMDLSGGKFDIEITGPIPSCPVKLAQLHPNEIDLIIPDEDEAVRPRYYRRRMIPYSYDFQAHEWKNEEERIYYYESLQYPPRETGTKPPQGAVQDGKIIHVAVNKTSFNLRGNSEVWVAVRWANALNDFFVWRLTLLRALATFPFRRKIRGGMGAVRDTALRIASGIGVNGEVENSTLGTSGNQFLENMGIAPPPVGSILTENENEQLEQMKTDSGSSSAATDISALRAQIGVGLGLTGQYLGEQSSTTLSNATAAEQPMLKRFYARQELMERVYEIPIDHAIRKAVEEGLIPGTADLTYKVEMPNILERNIPELVSAINQIVARLDPYAINFKLKRFLFLQGLTYLGVHNPQSVVEEVYPFGAEEEERAAIAAVQGFDPQSSPTNNGLSNYGDGQLGVTKSNLDPFKNIKRQAQPLERVGNEAAVTPEEFAIYQAALEELLDIIHNTVEKDLRDLEDVDE